MLPNPQQTADLVTFTEEILNGKLLFFARCEITVATCYTFFHRISLGDVNVFSFLVYIENISHLPEVIFTLSLMVGIVNLCF